MKASTLHPPKPKLSVFHPKRVHGSFIRRGQPVGSGAYTDGDGSHDGLYVITMLFVLVALALIILPLLLDLAFGGR